MCEGEKPTMRSRNVKRTGSLLSLLLIFSLCFTVMLPTFAYATDGDTAAITEGEISEETDTIPGPVEGDDEAAETEEEASEETNTPLAPAEEDDAADIEESEVTEEGTPVPGMEGNEAVTPAGEQGLLQLNTLFAPMGGGGTAQLTVANVVANAGDTGVTVDVSIEDCPVFYGMLLGIFYDKEALTLTAITRGPATSSEEGNFMGNPAAVDDGYGRVLFDGNLEDVENETFYMTASDGVLFTLTFDVAQTAGSGDYEINVSKIDFYDPYGQELPMNITNGKISVTGDPTLEEIASYDGQIYRTVNEAIAAVVSDGGTGTITMNNNTTIESYDDRIIIPAGANITLDMNGRTITSEIPGLKNNYHCVVEVQQGGVLNLVDNSAGKGGQFVHSTGEEYSNFLVNYGTLNMSDIGVYNFYRSITDGSTYDIKGSAGTYGTISNCNFGTAGTSYLALDFGLSNVEAIIGCNIIGGTKALLIGRWDGEGTGSIGLLEDCVITIPVNDYGEFGYLSATGIVVYGTIETIKDCTINSVNGCGIGVYPKGKISKITSTSADKHTTIGGDPAILNIGRIELIESNHTLVYQVESDNSYPAVWNWCDDFSPYNAGAIGEIAGGTFIGSYSAIYSDPRATIGEISGGFFRSSGCAAVETAGNINSITGGIFIGGPEGGALTTYRSSKFSDKYPDWEDPVIASVTGGYYKTLSSEYPLIHAEDGEINIPEGYGLSTMPTTVDTPDQGEEEGFYHLGETVAITWKVEGQEDKTDIFIKGDPVYYPYETPFKEGGEGFRYEFAGWSDGVTQYSPGQTLPVATADATYTAVFNQVGAGEDYTVSLATTAANVNAGEEFAVDVNIASVLNNIFYGADIEVTYDNSKVDYQGATGLPGGFNIISSTSETTTTLRIAGAASQGYTMTDHAYKLATLRFKAKSDVATGTATFGIADDPVVDQQDAVESQFVAKGDDITVNLWNLTVTFKAGANVIMATETAYVKYNEPGLYTDTSYTTTFSEPEPEAADNYTLDDPVWHPGSGQNVDFATIMATAFTDNATYTATASPSKYAITYPESVTVISGVTDGKATYLTPVVFTVIERAGYVVDKVTYTVGGGEPVTLTAGAGGKYTISGNAITGAITINDPEYIAAGTVTFISNDDFKSLPAGYKLLLLTVDNKLSSGAYKYDGNTMFYSSKYSTDGNHVYLYAVPNDIEARDALLNIQIEAGPCIELAYDGNVNLDTRLNSTDAVLTYALYNGIWADDVFTKVNMRMRLEADVNGDRTVDTTDAQKILNTIWGQ